MEGRIVECTMVGIGEMDSRLEYGWNRREG